MVPPPKNASGEFHAGTLQRGSCALPRNNSARVPQAFVAATVKSASVVAKRDCRACGLNACRDEPVEFRERRGPSARVVVQGRLVEEPVVAKAHHRAALLLLEFDAN